MSHKVSEKLHELRSENSLNRSFGEVNWKQRRRSQQVNQLVTMNGPIVLRIAGVKARVRQRSVKGEFVDVSGRLLVDRNQLLERIVKWRNERPLAVQPNQVARIFIYSAGSIEITELYKFQIYRVYFWRRILDLHQLRHQLVEPFVQVIQQSFVLENRQSSDAAVSIHESLQGRNSGEFSRFPSIQRILAQKTVTDTTIFDNWPRDRQRVHAPDFQLIASVDQFCRFDVSQFLCK